MWTCSMKPAVYSFSSCARNLTSFMDSFIESVFSLPHWAAFDPVSLIESAFSLPQSAAYDPVSLIESVTAPAASHVPSLIEPAVSFTESAAFDAVVLVESIMSLVASAHLSASAYMFPKEQKEEKHKQWYKSNVNPDLIYIYFDLNTTKKRTEI